MSCIGLSRDFFEKDRQKTKGSGLCWDIVPTYTSRGGRADPCDLQVVTNSVAPTHTDGGRKEEEEGHLKVIAII